MYKLCRKNYVILEITDLLYLIITQFAEFFLNIEYIYITCMFHITQM